MWLFHGTDFQPDLWHQHPSSKHRLEHGKVFLCESWEKKIEKLSVREFLKQPNRVLYWFESWGPEMIIRGTEI